MNVLPHEPEVRAWLRRVLGVSGEIQDVIQEAYCRIWSAAEQREIANPRGYLFQVVRNVVIDEQRRARVVRIDARAELEELQIPSDDPSPEQALSARRELWRVKALIEALPPRTRTILEMRKVEGLSQREIARRLNLSENVVENEAARGLKLIQVELAREEREVSKHQRPTHGRWSHGR